jgi:AcrR family transcriptional regulator
LTLEGIIGAAVGIADAEGLGGVSMASVAKALGFTTMSLYRYVTSKDELLVLMMDGAMGAPPAIADLGVDWRANLADWARALVARMLSHAWTMQIPVAGPVMTPNQLAWLEAGLHALEAVPLTEEEKANLVLLLSGFCRNEAVLRQDLAINEQRLRETTGEERPRYGEMMASLIDPEELPHLMRVIEAGVFDDDSGYGDEELEFGLDRLLDGFAVLIEARSDPSSPPLLPPPRTSKRRPAPKRTKA